jgi:hypothetical protein
MYHDKSCYRDKVNRAAGSRTGVMVFAGATYKLHRDMEHPPVYRDSAIWTLSPGRETSQPSTGTWQKPRHRDTDGN